MPFSPERLDNSVGYTDPNGTFICLEFQIGNGLQANKDYVEFLCSKETRMHPRIEEIMTGSFVESP
jgi:hypothetical protein